MESTLNLIPQISEIVTSLNLSPEMLTGLGLVTVFLALKIAMKVFKYVTYISLITIVLKTALSFFNI